MLLVIEYIAFACYSPRSDTSHGGGLICLHILSHISHVYSHLRLITFIEGGAVQETEEPWDVLHMQLSLQHVEVHADLCLTPSSCTVLISCQFK
jgi:hypothetical protein